MSVSPPGQQVTKGEEVSLPEGTLLEEKSKLSIVTVLDLVASFIGNRYQLDKPQAYLVVTLLILIALSFIFIILVWKFYSGVILDFSAKERRSRKEKISKKKEE